MADPTPAVRAVVYERDDEQCVSCGARQGLQFQHRQATGMGGSKVRPTLVQGLTSCQSCNPAYEAALQGSALRFGWKVRSWVRDCSSVPVYYLLERTWYQLVSDGSRVRLAPARAVRMMRKVYGDSYAVEEGLS